MKDTYFTLATVAATPAVIGVQCGFLPDRVRVRNPVRDVELEWITGMSASEAYKKMKWEFDMLVASTLVMGTSSNLKVKTSAFTAKVGDEVVVAAVAAETAFTATTHDVATGSKWASYRISVGATGTITITISASNDYATEALAIAALPATPTGETSLGYITIQSTAGAIWDATTDALAGGTGGTPAETTNYYAETAGSLRLMTTNGITMKGLTQGDSYRGFEIGLDTDLQPTAGDTLIVEAYR